MKRFSFEYFSSLLVAVIDMSNNILVLFVCFLVVNELKRLDHGSG